MSFNARSLLSFARSAARAVQQVSRATRATGGTGTPRRPPVPAPAPAPAGRSRPAGRSGNDVRSSGPFRPVYAPQPDGEPDPGEVVWAWVPYEDDPAQGKDRPVLLIGHSGRELLALMMTSRDRNNASGTDPRYVDVGAGPWDSKGRPSEVKLDRVLRLNPESIRREGSVLDRKRFELVADRFVAFRGRH